MKLVQFLIAIIISFSFISFQNNNSTSNCLAKNNSLHNLIPYAADDGKTASNFGPIEIGSLKRYYQQKNFNKNTLQELQYYIIDSLWNGYSFFSNDQHPIVYHTETGTLVMIKRGALADEAASGVNTLNNLFVRTSSDWGNTWSEPYLVYNSKVNEPKWNARYPSVYPIIYEGNLNFLFTAPIVHSDPNQSWQGFITGLHIVEQESIVNWNPNSQLNIGGQLYFWGTDASLVGGTTQDDLPWFLATGGIMPHGGDIQGDMSDNSNIGVRRTYDFGDYENMIPVQWSSNKFYVPQPYTSGGIFYDDSLRSSRIVKLKIGSSGELVMGVWGEFLSNGVENRLMPGVSVSNDLGQSWSEFDVASYSLVRDFATSKGVNPDSCSIWTCDDMAVLDNGDVSFIACFREFDATKGGTLNSENWVVEIYRENNVWGLREIGKITGFWVGIYNPETNTRSAGYNQRNFELQISRTPDGKNILAKWLDLREVTEDNVNNTYSYLTSDVFISTRAVGTNSWSTPVNITSDSATQRVVWIPDYIPNNLVGIPIFILYSIPNPNDDPTQASLRLINLNEPQWVTITHFDALVGVEDDNRAASNVFDINSVYPNPAGRKAEIRFETVISGNMKLEIYNLMGNKVKVLYDGYVSGGSHSMNINTADLPVGSYYLALSGSGNRVTKMINIIR